MLERREALPVPARGAAQIQAPESTPQVQVKTLRLGSLQDGTGYPARITLDTQAQKLSVTIENSGYRKVGP